MLKPLFKMRMFSNVDSKVVEELKKKEDKIREKYQQREEENIDNLIDNIQRDVDDLNK